MEFVCPHCSQAVQVEPLAGAQMFICPTCGGEFLVAGQDGSMEPAEVVSVEESSDRADELDGVRIRQLSQAKRAAIRGRSMCLIGAMFCIVGAIQLGIDVVRDMLSRQNNWLTAMYLLVAIGLLILAGVLLRKARELNVEAKRSSLPPPTSKPDFSTLDDGSQRWKDLEKL